METRNEEAAIALVEAVEALGLTAAPAEPDDHQGDVVLLDKSGRRVVIVEVKRQSLLNAADAQRLGVSWPPHDGDPLHLVVADRVTEAARRVLREAGVGWLDLRGHLRLTAPGLVIDTDVPTVRPRPQRVEAFAGKAGMEVACWLLMHTRDEPSVRQIARDLGRSASTVSEVLRALRSLGLLRADNTPVLPELFWETAAAWRPEAVALAGSPQPGQGPTNALLELGLDKPAATTGWALGDTLAAAAYGAPIGVKADYPPDYYVPTPTIARRAERYLHPAANWPSRGAVVRVAPVPAVCTHRVDAPQEHWPLVHPVFAALDLARDPARGREVLEGWVLPEPWQRVW